MNIKILLDCLYVVGLIATGLMAIKVIRFVHYHYAYLHIFMKELFRKADQY